MSTGEWLVVAGTILQLGSIFVLATWGYRFVQRLRTRQIPTGGIASIAVTGSDVARLKHQVSYHGQEIKALQQAVRELTERTSQPGNLELISAGVLTIGTLLNLAGAVVLALQP